MLLCFHLERYMTGIQACKAIQKDWTFLDLEFRSHKRQLFLILNFLFMKNHVIIIWRYLVVILIFVSWQKIYQDSQLHQCIICYSTRIDISSFEGGSRFGRNCFKNNVRLKNCQHASTLKFQIEWNGGNEWKQICYVMILIFAIIVDVDNSWLQLSFLASAEKVHPTLSIKNAIQATSYDDVLYSKPQNVRAWRCDLWGRQGDWIWSAGD